MPVVHVWYASNHSTMSTVNKRFMDHEHRPGSTNGDQSCTDREWSCEGSRKG